MDEIDRIAEKINVGRDERIHHLEGLIFGGVRDYRPDGSLTHNTLAIDHHKEDIEVPLQAIIVNLPSRHTIINGQPYNLAIHEDRLVSAINYFRVVSHNPGAFEPRLLEVRHVEKEEELNSEPNYSPENNAIQIAIPSKAYSQNLEAEKVAQSIQDKMNLDLYVGLREARELSNYLKLRYRLTKYSAIMSVAIAEGVGVANASGDSIEQTALKGAEYSARALALVCGLILAKMVFYQATENDPFNIRGAARHTSKKISKTKYMGKTVGKSYFLEPILILSPIT